MFEVSELSMAANEVAAVENVYTPGLSESLLISLMGMLIVFAVLAVLMCSVKAVSALIRVGARGGTQLSEDDAVKTAAAERAARQAETERARPVQAKPLPGEMFITLNGKRYAVSAQERLPDFRITLNGKTYGVEIEDCGEEDEK